MRVRPTEGGTARLINVSDFDPRLHVAVEAGTDMVDAPPPPPVTASGIEATLHTMNVEAARALVAEVIQANDGDRLAALRASEVSHPRFIGGRSSVLTAIDAGLSAMVGA